MESYESYSRKQLIEALKEAQKKEKLALDIQDSNASEISLLAQTLKSVQDCISITDKKDKLIYVNEAFLKTYGYSQDEIIGQHTSILRSKENKSSVENDILPSTLKGSWHGELINRKKDGNEFPVELWSSVVKNNSGDVIALVGIARDITERKRTEDELRKSEERYQNFMDNASEGIFLLELENPIDTRLEVDEQIKEIYKGRIEICNTPQAEMYGYKKPEEVIGLSLAQLHGGTDNPVNVKGIKEWIDAGYRILNTHTHEVDKNGNPIWFSNNVTGIVEDGFLIRIWGTQIDITNERKAQQALADSESKFRAIFETSNDAIGVSKNGLHSFVNPAYLKLFGYSKNEELQGKSVLEVIPTEEKAFIQSNIRKRQMGEKVPDRYETKGLKKNGQVFDMDVHATSFEFKGEKHMLVILRDISQEKKMRADLIVAKEHAEEADRIKSAFLANMSHEIRTPMNAILGFSELLESHELTEEDRKKFRTIIRDRSQDLLKIISDILDISVIEAGQLKLHDSTANLRSFINQVALFYHSGITQKATDVELRIHMDIPGDLLLIKTDFERLRQVLTNLINNAYKFTTKGSVNLNCSLQDDKMLMFSVEDTGCGISKEKLKVIFERFRQAEDSYLSRKSGGTGLGLSISKGLINLLGGDLWVESTLGKGSKFYFTLPFKPAKTQTKRAQKPRPKVFDWSDKTILVVEDDDTNTFYFKEVLAKIKAKVIYAADGRMAKSLMKKHRNIDLVLLDIRLPDINGFDLCRHIKKEDPELIVIAQTAFAGEADKKKSLAAGCDDFLAKPIKKELLFKTLKKHLS